MPTPPLQRIPEPALHLFGPLSLLLLGPRSHNYSVHTPRSTSALPGSSSIRTPCSSPARTRTGTPHGSPVIYIIRKNRQNVLSEAGKIFRLPGTRHEPADRACTEQLLRLLSVI